MSQTDYPRQNVRDPRRRQRSDALIRLLANCPEHLFSTDDSQLAPIRIDAKQTVPATAMDGSTGDARTGIAEPGLEKAA